MTGVSTGHFQMKKKCFSEFCGKANSQDLAELETRAKTIEHIVVVIIYGHRNVIVVNALHIDAGGNEFVHFHAQQDLCIHINVLRTVEIIREQFAARH